MATNTVKSFTVGAYTYEHNLVTCGKQHCHKCPHGPYWYQKIRLRTGKTVKKYLGKELPEGVEVP